MDHAAPRALELADLAALSRRARLKARVVVDASLVVLKSPAVRRAVAVTAGVGAAAGAQDALLQGGDLASTLRAAAIAATCALAVGRAISADGTPWAVASAEIERAEQLTRDTRGQIEDTRDEARARIASLGDGAWQPQLAADVERRFATMLRAARRSPYAAAIYSAARADRVSKAFEAIDRCLKDANRLSGYDYAFAQTRGDLATGDLPAERIDAVQAALQAAAAQLLDRHRIDEDLMTEVDELVTNLAWDAMQVPDARTRWEQRTFIPLTSDDMEPLATSSDDLAL